MVKGILIIQKLNFILLCLVLSLLVSAQKVEGTSVDYKSNSGFAISRPLSEMPVVKDGIINSSSKKESHLKKKSTLQTNHKETQNTIDPIAQQNMGNKTASPPIVNFQALTGSGIPPDPTGAAGPSHYVQAVNFVYNVYDKTGASLGGPFNLGAIWSVIWSGGDPIVLYDKYADRWFIHQVYAGWDYDSLLIAVSTTSNPLGSYYTYTFVPEPGDMVDYGKFSVWADGYYSSLHYYSGKKKLAVFDRAKMIAGNPTAGMILMTLPLTPSTWFFSPLPADADGQLPPYGTPCPIFYFEDDTWSAGGVDQLRIYKLTTDWITPSNSTLVLDQTLLNSPINVNFDSVNYQDIPQPGTTNKLIAWGIVLNFRAQYRRWTGYNSVVINHPVIVNASTKQVGIRWYELRQNISTNSWSIYQEGTYAPDLHSRWLGSIAMDDNGSIGMAYSVSSNTIFPSLCYTGRNASDPLGQMTYSETTAFSGTSSQLFSNPEYGDYSQTSLDPTDGITFWHTGEYHAGGGQKTRVFSWQIPNFAGINDINNKPELLVFQNENNLNIKGIKLPGDDQTQVDLFDILGKLIASKMVIPVANSIETTINVSGLSKGTYLVRIGNAKFQKVVKVSVN